MMVTTPYGPSLLSSLRMSAITTSSNTLSWNAVTGATQYNLRQGGVVSHGDIEGHRRVWYLPSDGGRSRQDS